jgi:hypothetical protein
VVYRREVELLCAAADELALSERPDVALEEWMQRFVGYIATKRGMANSLRLLLATKSELFAKASGMVPQAMHRLVEAAAAGGYIRKDVESSDVLHALSGIYSAPDSPHWRERSRRLVLLSTPVRPIDPSVEDRDQFAAMYACPSVTCSSPLLISKRTSLAVGDTSA